MWFTSRGRAKGKVADVAAALTALDATIDAQVIVGGGHLQPGVDGIRLYHHAYAIDLFYISQGEWVVMNSARHTLTPAAMGLRANAPAIDIALSILSGSIIHGMDGSALSGAIEKESAPDPAVVNTMRARLETLSYYAAGFEADRGTTAHAQQAYDSAKRYFNSFDLAPKRFAFAV
ncbi:hypothetical protein [Leifsonia sp. Leaf264]|uniref:hypothetical protein n=1 Tax=Leifsonia sp. Leaf264 TaxID=1736314 RepID=UPI0006F65B1D|nr:hypothetical protein [Leifsonia sp. Leaf264]KQO98741.1 hypothetical protein ASF30_11815 [Leifsonia sp. Leaf264]